jgi:hypothetical protein
MKSFAWMLVAVLGSLGSTGCRADVALQSNCEFLKEDGNSENKDVGVILKQYLDASAVKLCVYPRSSSYFLVSPIFTEQGVQHFSIDKIIKSESDGGKWVFDVPDTVRFLDRREIYMCLGSTPCLEYGDSRFVGTMGIPLSVFVQFTKSWNRVMTSIDEFDGAISSTESKSSRGVSTLRTALFEDPISLKLNSMFLEIGARPISPQYRASISTSNYDGWLITFDLVEGNIRISDVDYVAP